MSFKDVFVFGAGASHASAGLPLGRELVWRNYPVGWLLNENNVWSPTEEEFKKCKLYEKFLRLVEEVFPDDLKTKKLLDRFQECKRKHETFIEPFFNSNAQKYYADNIIWELMKKGNDEGEKGIELIRRLIFEHITKPKNVPKENLYKKFLGKIDNDSIIMTLNFDALIERIILEDNKHFNYLLDFDCKEDGKDWYKEEGISLIKLNGSVNWGICSQSDCVAIMNFRQHKFLLLHFDSGSLLSQG